MPKEIDLVLARERQQWENETQELRIKLQRVETDYQLLSQSKSEGRPPIQVDYTQVLAEQEREWNARK